MRTNGSSKTRARKKRFHFPSSPKIHDVKHTNTLPTHFLVILLTSPKNSKNAHPFYYSSLLCVNQEIFWVRVC